MNAPLVDTKTLPARFFHLRAMALSPAHAFAAFQGEQNKGSLAMRVGSGTHAMLFDLPYSVYTGQRRAKVKAWEDFQAEHPDDTILSPGEYERAKRVAESVRSHPIASQLLFGPGTVREETLLWSQSGRARRSTPDVRGPYHVAELKTCRCAAPAEFPRSAGFMAYHAQVADQRCAIEAATGTKPDEAYIVAVESSAPFAVTVFQLTDMTLQSGERMTLAWLSRLLEAERTDSWPAYSDQIEMLDLPLDGLDAAFVEGFDEPEAEQPPGDAA